MGAEGLAGDDGSAMWILCDCVVPVHCVVCVVCVYELYECGVFREMRQNIYSELH